jgi:hypothetical protein
MASVPNVAAELQHTSSLHPAPFWHAHCGIYCANAQLRAIDVDILLIFLIYEPISLLVTSASPLPLCHL